MRAGEIGSRRSGKRILNLPRMELKFDGARRQRCVRPATVARRVAAAVFTRVRGTLPLDNPVYARTTNRSIGTELVIMSSCRTFESLDAFCFPNNTFPRRNGIYRQMPIKFSQTPSRRFVTVGYAVGLFRTERLIKVSAAPVIRFGVRSAVNPTGSRISVAARRR